MNLDEEINAYKLDLLENTRYFTIEELAKMYQRGEIDIYYNSKKATRWDNKKQDKLIKNILLGFPIPPIFFGEGDGEYLVLDGYNRIYTILRFLNIVIAWIGHPFELPYKVEMSHPRLPSFKGTVWENGKNVLSDNLKERFLNYRVPVYFKK